MVAAGLLRMYDLCVLPFARLTLSFIFATAACSCSSGETRTAEVMHSTTHAVVELRRSKFTNTALIDQANVLVSVLRVPATLDSRNIVRLVGLSSSSPEPGSCERIDYARTSTEATAAVQRVEMLDVGEVTLVAEGRSSTLARQAFPTVTDFIAGVVYTTRDLSSEPLPPASSYSILARGAGKIAPFRIDATAPEEISNVTLEGVPLPELSGVVRGAGTRLAWKPGRIGDKLVVEIKSPDRPGDVNCAFDDSAGHGNLPPDAFVSIGTVRLEIHRLRKTSLTTKGLDRSEVAFDYSLVHLLEIVQ